MLGFRRGERGAFDALFRRWAEPLLRYLTRMVGDPAVAEELTQEAFLRVHRSRDRYRPEARFSTWLYTIATNLARNELRRPFRRHRHLRDGDEDGQPLASGSPAVDELVSARREGVLLTRALGGLPDRQREALLLCVEGLSYAEIASALGTTASSVKALIHRARANLVKATAEEERDER